MTSRFEYRPGHPCYRPPDADDPEGEEGPAEGEEGVDGEAGPDGGPGDADAGGEGDPPGAAGDGAGGANANLAFAADHSSAYGSLFSDEAAEIFEDVSEDELPFPVQEISYMGENIKEASREKIVTNLGIAYQIYDRRMYEFTRNKTRDSVLEELFAEFIDANRTRAARWDNYDTNFFTFLGLPGVSSMFQDPRNSMHRNFFDPLRATTGRAWYFHEGSTILNRQPNCSAANEECKEVFKLGTQSMAQHSAYFGNRFSVRMEANQALPNEPLVKNVRSRGVSWLEEDIFLHLGGAYLSSVSSQRFVESNGAAADEALKKYLKLLLFGSDKQDHSVTKQVLPHPSNPNETYETGLLIPATRAEIEAMATDAEKVRDIIESRYFLDGVFGSQTIEIPNPHGNGLITHPKTYFDYAHKTQMPFFEEELKKMNFNSALTADIQVHRNYFSEEFKESGRPSAQIYQRGGPRLYSTATEKMLKIPSCYRIYRSRKRPDPNCIGEKPTDKILKFTANNIKEMNKVTEEYKNLFPITAQIRFQTTQLNNVSDLFKQYNMDKFFLDQREKFMNYSDIDDQTENRMTTALTRYGSDFEEADINPLIMAQDLGGYSCFGIKTFSEFLNQSATLGNEDSTKARYMGQRYNQATKPWNSAGPIDNVKFNPSTEMRICTFKNFMENLRANNGPFAESMFPLGTGTLELDQGAPPEFSTIYNKFNRDIFDAKITSLPFDSYEDGSGVLGKEKRYMRTYSDIVNGELAYSETIGYVIEKYEHDLGSKKLVQKFYFFDSSDVTEINFLDNQFRYNKRYTYIIKAINCVFGSEYYYNLMSQHVQAESDPNNALNFVNYTFLDDGDNFNFIDEFSRERAASDASAAIGDALVGEIKEGLQDNAIAAQLGKRWMHKALRTKVRSKPSIAFIEVPYYKKEIYATDLPPMPPQVEIVPYKDVYNRVLVNVTPTGGKTKALPVALFGEDQRTIRRMHEVQDLSLDSPIEFSGDSIPTEYELLILENPDEPPRDIFRFSSANRRLFGDLLQTSGNLHKDIEIMPNCEYYICVRAIDDAGISLPSEVFYMQVVKYEDGVYFVLEEYKFPEEEVVKEVTFKRAISLKPTAPQISGLSPESLITSTGDTPNIWDKEYRLSLKSNSTGRKIDVDYSFEVTVLPPPPPAPLPDDHPREAAEELCFDQVLLGASVDRRDNPLYTTPEQMGTGSVDEINMRLCGSYEASSYKLAVFKHYDELIARTTSSGLGQRPMTDAERSARTRQWYSNHGDGVTGFFLTPSQQQELDLIYGMPYDEDTSVAQLGVPGTRISVVAADTLNVDQRRCECPESVPWNHHVVWPAKRFITKSRVRSALPVGDIAQNLTLGKALRTMGTAQYDYARDLYNRYSNRGGLEGACIVDNCPANSELAVGYYVHRRFGGGLDQVRWHTNQSNLRLVLYCKCREGYSPCRGDCIADCDVGHQRNVEDCGCRVSCRPALGEIWDAGRAQCVCPADRPIRGQGGICEPEPPPPPPPEAEPPIINLAPGTCIEDNDCLAIASCVGGVCVEDDPPAPAPLPVVTAEVEEVARRRRHEIPDENLPSPEELEEAERVAEEFGARTPGKRPVTRPGEAEPDEEFAPPEGTRRNNGFSPQGQGGNGYGNGWDGPEEL